MNRSRTPSAPTLVAGSLLAGSIAVLVLVMASSSTTGCSSAEQLTAAPDAAEPLCERGPFTFCSAVDPTLGSCNTDNGTSVYLTRLPKSTEYPVGCVINFVGARDQQGDCRLDAVCKCVVGELPSTGDDAGADGGTSDGGATTAKTGPIWNCSP